MTVYPGPDTGSTRLVASMDDERGLSVTVYRDHDGVRIDAGGTEITLTRAGAATLESMLEEAGMEAALWGLTNE